MPVSLKRRYLPTVLALALIALSAGISGFFSKNSPNSTFSQITFDKPVGTVSAAAPFVSANGTELSLNGERYQFTGVNAFNLATLPGSNAGCGGYVENLDSFLSNLRPNSTVRLWAFQGTMATNVDTKQINWAGLDRVVNAAQKNNIKLIFVLSEQAGACDDGHWKDRSWYEGGYKQSFNDFGNGLTPLPYLEYVKLIVARYKDSSAVAMWEPVNEATPAECLNAKGDDCWAELSCPDEAAAAQALRTFYDTVGGAIKSIDPNHLVSSGMIGDGQCGTVWEDYQYVHASDGIDVASYHDYSHVDEPLPGDEWNGMQKRLEQMKLLNKPLIVGEIGMLASANGTGCMTYTTRRDKMKAKMDAQFAAGIAGYIPWSFTAGQSSVCNYDIVGGDPLLTLLWDYPVSMGPIVTQPSSTPFPTPTPKPIDTQAPTAPVLSASGLTANQVTLSWSASTDNVSVVRYDIFRNYSYVTSTTGTTFTNSNLLPSTTYMYYVKGRDAADNSSPASNKVSVKTLVSSLPTPIPTTDTQAPTVPTNLASSALSATQVTLTWTASTDNVGVARYEVYRDYAYVTATTGTNFVNSNLTPGKTYLYYLKARDAAGNSSGSSVKLTVTTPTLNSTPTPTPIPVSVSDTQAPTAPTNLTAVFNSNQVNLKWNAATDNVAVVRYDVYRNYMYITSTTGTTLTNTQIAPSTSYMYYVKAKDGVGNVSVASNKASVITPLF